VASTGLYASQHLIPGNHANIPPLSFYRPVDYIMVQQEDKAKVRNVKVIPNEECVPKHKLLVMDMQFSTRKRRCKKFDPRVRVWKLKEEKT